jgi:DNA-binding transcriptional ArsR family regulator
MARVSGGTQGDRKGKGSHGRAPLVRSKSARRHREADLIAALNHRLRRQILRILHAAGEPRSPSRIAAQLQEDLSGISYHVKVLVGLDVIGLVEKRQAGGTFEHVYTSKVADDRIATELLAATREADEVRPAG